MHQHENGPAEEQVRNCWVPEQPRYGARQDGSIIATFRPVPAVMLSLMSYPKCRAARCSANRRRIRVLCVIGWHQRHCEAQAEDAPSCDSYCVQKAAEQRALISIAWCPIEASISVALPTWQPTQLSHLQWQIQEAGRERTHPS